MGKSIKDENIKNKTEEFELKRKRKNARNILLVVMIAFILISVRNHYGILMSEKQKTRIINKIVSGKNYEKAMKVNDIYFGGSDKESISMNRVTESIIEMCQTTNTRNMDEALKKTKELQEYVNTVEITKLEVVPNSASYHDVKITIKNNGNKNLSYVEIGLDFEDANGNIIQSDWTNDSSTIKVGATQTLKKMISTDIKYAKVLAEVKEFR